MTADKMREDFEAWRKNVFKQRYVFNEDGAGFKDPKQDIVYESWQAATAESAAKLGGDVDIYLKDGETVVQRLERERLEVITTLNMLAKERGIVEKQAAKIAELQGRIDELVKGLKFAKSGLGHDENIAVIDEIIAKVKDVK